MNYEIKLEEYNQFVDYCHMFYGEGEIYGEHGFATKQQIREAINIYVKNIKGEQWGGGDSVDRENVGNILMEEFDINLYNWKAEA